MSIVQDSKITNLKGTVEKCTDWIVEAYCQKIDNTYMDVKEIYSELNVFEYRDVTYAQRYKIIIDAHGIGGVYVNYLDKVGIKFENLDVKNVNL